MVTEPRRGPLGSPVAGEDPCVARGGDPDLITPCAPISAFCLTEVLHHRANDNTSKLGLEILRLPRTQKAKATPVGAGSHSLHTC